MRLSKFLAQAGICSRRHAEKLIVDGRVKVNNTLATLPQTDVDPSKDKISVDNKKIEFAEEKIYFILNKPKGYICSNKRFSNQKIVTDLFKEFPHRLFTVGRLDKDTTGLIFITNDGHFAQSLIHPSKDITKEYVALVKQPITDEHLKKLKNGAPIDNVWITPVKVKKTNVNTVHITVKEGKKHEIKHFIQRAKLDLLHLSRIRIGDYHLGSLKEGSYKRFRPKNY